MTGSIPTGRLSRLGRAATALGVVSVIAGGYVLLSPPTPLNFIHAGPGGAAVLIVFGIVAIIGGRMSAAGALTLLAGIGLTAAAVYQLVSLVLAPLHIFGGDASLTAVLAGLGIGLLSVAAASRGQLR